MTPSRPVSLVHHSALAIIPPPAPDSSATWTSLQQVRYSLRDKGVFRWTPHINILYPFITPEHYDSILPGVELDMSAVSPFTVFLREFGVFGGRDRGVLWLDPIAARDGIDSLDAKECSSESVWSSLHSSLVKSVASRMSEVDDTSTPQSNAAKLAAKPFRPHMTMTHADSRAQAEEFGRRMREDWSEVSFQVNELFVLERRGDGGQFHIAWRLPLLGASISERPADGSKKASFDRMEFMPEEEEVWVREARLSYREKSKRRSYKGSNQSRTTKPMPPGDGASPFMTRKPTSDTPEEIEAKRAARAMKRERLLREEEEKKKNAAEYDQSTE